MAEVFIYGLPLIALIAAAFLVYYFFPAAFPPFWRHAHVPNQGVIRRDWVAGRSARNQDFAPLNWRPGASVLSGASPEGWP